MPNSISERTIVSHLSEEAKSHESHMKNLILKIMVPFHTSTVHAIVIFSCNIITILNFSYGTVPNYLCTVYFSMLRYFLLKGIFKHRRISILFNSFLNWGVDLNPYNSFSYDGLIHNGKWQTSVKYFLVLPILISSVFHVWSHSHDSLNQRKSAIEQWVRQRYYFKSHSVPYWAPSQIIIFF